MNSCSLASLLQVPQKLICYSSYSILSYLTTVAAVFVWKPSHPYSRDLALSVVNCWILFIFFCPFFHFCLGSYHQGFKHEATRGRPCVTCTCTVPSTTVLKTWCILLIIGFIPQPLIVFYCINNGYPVVIIGLNIWCFKFLMQYWWPKDNLFQCAKKNAGWALFIAYTCFPKGFYKLVTRVLCAANCLRDLVDSGCVCIVGVARL